MPESESLQPIVIEEPCRQPIVLGVIGVDAIAVWPEAIARSEDPESPSELCVGRFVFESRNGVDERLKISPRYLEEGVWIGAEKPVNDGELVFRGTRRLSS